MAMRQSGRLSCEISHDRKRRYERVKNGYHWYEMMSYGNFS